MKALALRSRGENKDAYDLAYVLQNQEGGTDAIAKRMTPLLVLSEAVEAMQRLDEDFATIDSIGPWGSISGRVATSSRP
jgi:hypothetical protein